MMDLKFRICVAGLAQDVTLTGAEVERVYRPLLQNLLVLPRTNCRAVVFLAGPPGSGKSTVAALLAVLAQNFFQTRLIVLPMDGFHFPNAHLATQFIRHEGDRICLAERKGAPESFDRIRLKRCLKDLSGGADLRWPIYDRTIHDVVPDALEVPGEGIFVVEGNYLLLDEPGWRDLARFAHRRIFIAAPEPVLLDRLIARHVRGGKTSEAARHWVLRTDLANIRRVQTHRLPTNIEIMINEPTPLRIDDHDF